MHATWLKKDLEDLHFNSFLYVLNSMSWGQWSNGKNDDLGGSSSTKPEGGLILKLSEEADHVTVSKTYILTAHKAMRRAEDKSRVPRILRLILLGW